jgi:catechol 2,3-dioxygenase-like lactoylglutathione lyase family enzyme
MGTKELPEHNPPPRIARLHHAQITIPAGAEDAARRFYCGVLGLAEITKPTTLAGRGGIWVAVGEMEVHIGTEYGVDRLATKAHLAYEVTSLAAWREHIALAGCTIVESVPIPGYDRFEARDPFGNRIEFISRAE